MTFLRTFLRPWRPLLVGSFSVSNTVAEMKKPVPETSTWTSSGTSQQVHVSGTNKKFKRKSREPKRLFMEAANSFPMDLSDTDSLDDPHMVMHHVAKLAPLQRQLMMSQDAATNGTGVLPEESVAPGQSGAIDMRIGINVPSNGPSRSPDSPSSNHQISHWPPSISQPLSSRLKLGLPATFPLPSPTGPGSSPGHQMFPLDMPGQSAALTLPRTPQSSQCLEHVEVQLSSPKVSLEHVQSQFFLFSSSPSVVCGSPSELNEGSGSGSCDE